MTINHRLALRFPRQEPGWGVTKHSALSGETREVFMAVAEIHTLRSGCKESSKRNVYLSACLFWAHQAMWLVYLEFSCNLKAELDWSNLPHSYYYVDNRKILSPGPQVTPFMSTGERNRLPQACPILALRSTNGIFSLSTLPMFYFINTLFCKLPRAWLQEQLPLFTSAPLSTW